MSQSIERCLHTLELLKDGPKSIAEIGRLLGVHRSTALRILRILETKDFVWRSEDASYGLGPSIIDLGYSALENIDIRAIARPIIETLSASTGETVHLAVMSGGQSAVYIDKVDSRHPVRMYSRVGLVAPLHCTGVGKALLAGMDKETRKRILENYDFVKHTETTRMSLSELEIDLSRFLETGYVQDDEEHERGIHCISRPVMNRDGTVAASLSLSTLSSRLPKEKLLAQAPRLIETVKEIEKRLGRLH